MKTYRRFRYALGMVLALWATGVVTVSAANASASAPAPQVSVSLRGDGSGTLEAGEPFHVAVRLSAPRGTTGAIELAPVSGTWVDAVRVELFTVANLRVVATALPASAPESASATLDAKRIAGGVWRFTPESTRALAPGDYLLRVKLAVTGGRGWTGERRSDEIPVRIVAAPTGANSAGAATRAINRARDAALTGHLESAAGTLDDALRATPLNPALLIARAEIAEQAGNLPAALLCVNAASLGAGNANTKSGGHPDSSLDALQTRLAKAQRTGAALTSAPGNPPAWTWPPFEVITAITAEARKTEFGRSLAVARGAKPAAAPAANPPFTATAQTASASTGPTRSSASNPTSVTPANTAAAAPAQPMPAHPDAIVVASAELDETKILADSAGQWAASAAAGSQYSSPNYAPPKMTGAPDVPAAGDNFNAWCPANDSKTDEWVELVFAKPTHATEIRVRQTNAPGAIVKVEVFEPNGTAHVWWSGTDPFNAPSQASLAWFAVRVPRTSYVVAKVKLTLNLAAVPGWNEIDAVQLVGAP